MQRLGSVLWLLAVAGIAGVAGEVWVDAVHDGDAPVQGAALFVGAVSLVVAAPTWWLRRLELQQLAMLGAAVTTVVGLVDAVAATRDTEMTPLAAGLAVSVLGAGWLAGGLFGRLPPLLLARLSGSFLVLIGTQIIREGNDHAGLWLGLAAAVALLVIGVAWSHIDLLLAGTVGLFQWTPQIALFYLEDTLGAEATLFVIGTLFIVLAGLMSRLYPWVKARRVA